MHRLYCSTLVAALLMGASLIADAGASAQPAPSVVNVSSASDASLADRDGFLLIAIDEAGEVTGIDLVAAR